MSNGCICDIDDKCVCSNDDERIVCDHWHLPAPRILSPRARSSYLNDLRDQGETRIKHSQQEGRDRVADSKRATADLMKHEGGLKDWQEKQTVAARARVSQVQRPQPSRMDDPSEGTGSGKPAPGGMKMR